MAIRKALLISGLAATVAVDGQNEKITIPEFKEFEEEPRSKVWAKSAEMYEYVSNANPPMSEIPLRVFPPKLHQEGATRVVPFDLSKELELDYAATSPNLLAHFVRIVAGDSLKTSVSTHATSQAFYMIRGKGKSLTRDGEVSWEAGDYMVLPYLGAAEAVCEGSQCVQHTCLEEPEFGGCAIYWVHDEPLLQYLGVQPVVGKRRFEPAFYPGKEMLATVHNLSGVNADGTAKNRQGILLGNSATPQTRTLTPTMWSLLNVLSSGHHQRPHKHNSVALDFAVTGDASGKIYTKMGSELDEDGNIVNPVVAEWLTGGAFVTPPGWWHSHHNEAGHDAWVLPVQYAGVYTHQRTLDIRFADDEAERVRAGKSRGATYNRAESSASPNLFSS